MKVTKEFNFGLSYTGDEWWLLIETRTGFNYRGCAIDGPDGGQTETRNQNTK